MFRVENYLELRLVELTPSGRSSLLLMITLGNVSSGIPICIISRGRQGLAGGVDNAFRNGSGYEQGLWSASRAILSEVASRRVTTIACLSRSPVLSLFVLWIFVHLPSIDTLNVAGQC
jgi:MFS family permease